MKNASAYLQSLVTDAVVSGRRCATFTGDYEIDEAIRLPSNFTVILENCHIRLADGTYLQTSITKPR